MSNIHSIAQRNMSSGSAKRQEKRTLQSQGPSASNSRQNQDVADRVTLSSSSVVEQNRPPSDPPVEQSLEGIKVVVDAGHGGKDPGAVGSKGQEKEVALAVSRFARDELEARGAEVLMTRDDDTFLTLQERVNLANNWDADLFVSVHANSFTNPNANGTETFHARVSSQTSKVMAKHVQDEMIRLVGLTDRGVKSAGFFVIRNTNMPAVLAETGFISNPGDQDVILDVENQKKFGLAIANGVEKTVEERFRPGFFQKVANWFQDNWSRLSS